MIQKSPLLLALPFKRYMPFEKLRAMMPWITKGKMVDKARN